MDIPPVHNMSTSIQGLHTHDSHRPTVKRTYHTWPATTTPPRSHFEDFLNEIGENIQSHHLCCVPIQGHTSLHTPLQRRTSSSSSRTKPKAAFLVKNEDDKSDTPMNLAPAQKQLRGRTFSSPTSAQVQRRNFSEFSTTSTSERGTRERTQSFSVAGRCYQRRLSTFSITSAARSIVGTSVLKAEASSAVDSHNQNACGPSVPATSARHSLQLLLGHDTEPEQPTDSAIRTQEIISSLHIPPFPEQIIPLPSDAVAPTIRPRSLSRSPSSDSLASTASSSEAPQTPQSHSPHFLTSHELSPTLADLEEMTRFRIRALCTTCGKGGSNFPSCARCGDMWCSRECRLKANQGRRHSCRDRIV